jgi:CRP/FNR family transcriptional regulator, cyclic AMP receptor protein
VTAGLQPDDWSTLHDAGTEQESPAGQVLVREGATGGSLFLILSGTVVITRGGRRIAELGESTVFGEAAMLDGGPRTASAIVEQDARLVVVPARVLHELIESRPELRDRLLEEAQSRLLA